LRTTAHPASADDSVVDPAGGSLRVARANGLAQTAGAAYVCGVLPLRKFPIHVHGGEDGRPVSPFHPTARQRRATLAMILVAVAIASVAAAFYRTQVIRAEDFSLRSDENRLRLIPIPAPRGTVYDRNGELIAETLVSYALYLERGPLDSARVRLQTVAPFLELDSARIDDLMERVRAQPNQPLLIANALSFEEVSRIEERRMELPFVELEARPLRRYPEGEAVAHLVGHVAEISERELADSAWQGYRMGQQIGKSGVERTYERTLGGRQGARYMEVDARGRMVGAFTGGRTVSPTAGHDVELTLDVELQRFTHSVFPEGYRGAVVAMVPSTGEILALYSNPGYDPNLLVGGVSPANWRALNEHAGRPLLNRATHGIYPPGSTWKLATALIALEKGVVTPSARLPLACNGGMSYAGRYSRCWNPRGHGLQDLASAIANSCNVYFYQLGVRLGLNQLAREGARLGFNRRTGIDLPTEASGTFPDGSEWYRRRFGWTPTPSEVMSLSIGQGPNAQTPLRMAQFFSALAGDGTARVPHLRRVPLDQLPIETDLNVSPATLAAVREGLARVTAPGGTAYMASLRRWKLSGKTGTSQNTEDPRRPHAWFTGFAGPPDGAPEIVVAVIVEFGESGSQAAAPVAAKVADFYLNRRYGFETELGAQTLRERQRVGRAAPVAPPSAPGPDALTPPEPADPVSADEPALQVDGG
jgi:penicillin-binding protein 2